MGTKKIDICGRSFSFSIRIIKLSLTLSINSSHTIIGKQVLRSGTSIGANIEEAQNSSSKKEFIHSLTIALKEARETYYWLRLLVESGIISKLKLENLLVENQEIIKILTAIVKNSKKKKEIEISKVH